jgi:death on curing protein
MIDFDEVLDIHHALIQKFGGTVGVRDEGLLQAALERPFSGFGEIEFYPTAEEKAAAILESIVTNHPFIDGNKRTGYVLMRLLVMQYGKDIRASQDEKYEFVIAIASGEMDFQQVLTWIKDKIVTFT